MTNQIRWRLPDVKKNANIGLLGGSFDPPHLCHELLALSFLALEPITDLWVIPCANHAFKNQLTGFEHRLAMCRLAYERINNVHVLDIENHLPSPNFTINTIDAILQTRPDLSIYFGLGSDLVSSFDRWHRAPELAQKTAIVIFERESYPITEIPASLSGASIHNGYVLPNSNSTDLRNYLSDPTTVSSTSFLDRRVLEYIKSHKLYQK